MLIGYIIVFILGVWFGVLAVMTGILITSDRSRRHRDDQKKT